jgi:AraC-like DNA-binding protein/quercetin dioxygenase-like cupin family protein
MLAWRSILVQKVEIQALGFSLKKLQLHRHRRSEIKVHGHPYAQLLLYLTGEGRQQVGDRRYPARPGDLFIIPAEEPHGFQATGEGPTPLCLAVDFDAARSPARFAHRRLDRMALNQLHGLLAKLPPKGRLRLADYSTVIAAAALLLEPLRARRAVAPPDACYERVRELLEDPASWNEPLATIARRAGYQEDYLTRKLRRERGRGLREIRDDLRQEAAEASLMAGASIAAAAAEAGFNDPSYFARWFRRRAGRSPTSFRADRGPAA